MLNKKISTAIIYFHRKAVSRASKSSFIINSRCHPDNGFQKRSDCSSVQTLPGFIGS